MRKLDYSLYGSDETGMASRISSEALGAPREYEHSGEPVDQSAKSKGSHDVEEATAKVKNMGGGDDERACPEGNHGKSGCNE